MAQEDYIKMLLRLTTDKYGESLETPKDFTCLSFAIQSKTGGRISVSSLKRLFGYVRYGNRPSINTLNILAQYACFRDFKAFCRVVVSPDTLPEGSLFEIRGRDGLCLTIEYIGALQFKIKNLPHMSCPDNGVFRLTRLYPEKATSGRESI